MQPRLRARLAQLESKGTWVLEALRFTDGGPSPQEDSSSAPGDASAPPTIESHRATTHTIPDGSAGPWPRPDASQPPPPPPPLPELGADTAPAAERGESVPTKTDTVPVPWLDRLSITVTEKTYVPAAIGVKLGVAVAAFSSTTGGPETCCQMNVSVPPPGAELAEASRVTGTPPWVITEPLAVPELLTRTDGGCVKPSTTVITATDGSDDTSRELRTISENLYVPTELATNVGAGTSGPGLSTAGAPPTWGQLYESGSPPGSSDSRPSSCTVAGEPLK